MTVLIIQKYSRIAQKFSSLLMTEFKLDSVQAINEIEAIDCLEQKKFSFIVVDYPLGKNSQKFFDILNENQEQVPILFTPARIDLSAAQMEIPGHPWIGIIPYDSPTAMIKRSIQKLLEIFNRRNQGEDKYCSIHISFFLKSQTVPCNIYVKINENKFIKVFKQGDRLTPEDIYKFEERHCEFFYLQPNDYLQVTDRMLERFCQAKKSESNDFTKTALSLYAHDSVHQMINKLGLNEHALEIASVAMTSLLEVSQSDSKLIELLKLLSQKQNFISGHSIMLSYLTCAIASELEWSSYTTHLKLTTAAFFHDIFIEDENLAKVKRLDSIEAKTFERKVIEEYASHPERTVSFFETIKGLPPDIDKIILQHHERPDAQGFPIGIDYKRIFVLSAIFIVAEDLICSIYDSGLTQFNLQDILGDFEQKYNKGNYKVAMEGLKKAIKMDEVPTTYIENDINDTTKSKLKIKAG